jgi:hypothetical protein
MSSLPSQARASKTTGPAIPLYVGPSTRQALEALTTLLLDYHYSGHAIGRIAAYVAREGTPTGCPTLDPEDEADATEAYVTSLAEVPLDSPMWDKYEDVCLDVALLEAGTHPWPIPAFGDDDREAPDGALPPIRGGSDEAEPFVPSDEDWAAYREWAERHDALAELRAAEERHNPQWGYE